MSHVETQSISDFSEKSYLDYSMYVILDRALPYIGDGLKPVQRRIVYAMSELGLKASAKYKKSARTVGDVLGKFHPHGDSACYEAMVHMAQDFSFRYALVDGQGNWGSADDPKSFAAMRYTEAKLSKYTELLLSELGQGTVDWQPNFDGSLKEPKLLPARLPNLLLNGTTGIAVGMATDIPPHNLQEIANACVYLLDNPNATLDDICEIVQGPDFPTGAEIISTKQDIMAAYATGHGSVRARAVYSVQQGEIIINELPCQVSGAKILEQIAAQMQNKKLPMLTDLRDESDHEHPTRLVLITKSSRIDAEALMLHLFATTDLERTYRINMNVIGLDNRPQVKGLLTILNEWLVFRLNTVTRRLQYRLEKIIDRLHLLDGLLIAYLNIDEVIHIIRTEDDPKSVLIQKFSLSDRQAEAILDMKLRHLAKLEETKIRGEQAELNIERRGIEKILASKTQLRNLVRQEIMTDAESFADARRAPIVQRLEAKAIREEEMLANDPVTIVLSQKGWVRAAKGHEINVHDLSYKAGDAFLVSAFGRSNQNAVFFDSTGRAYTLSAHTLASARGQGEPLTGRLNPPAGAEFVAVISGEAEQKYLLASDAGYGFIAALNQLFVRNRSGKEVLKLPENSALLAPQKINDPEQDLLAAVNNDGKLLVFPIKQLPELARGKGNKIMNIPSAKAKLREEYLLDIAVIPAGGQLIIYAGKRHLNLSAKDLSHYLSERGKRGAKLPRGFQKVDRIASA